MKNVISIVSIVLVVLMLAATLVACGGSEKTTDPTVESTEATSNADFASMKKLSEVIAVSSDGGTASNDQVISYIFKYNGKLYRAKAVNTAEIDERINALDFFAEDYQAQRDAILGEAELISVDDISDSIPTQDEMDALIGKTGQELLDMGFTINTCDASEEGISCTMEKDYAAYIITCAEKIDYHEGIDTEALFKTMKVTKVEYNGESMAAYDLPEEE